MVVLSKKQRLVLLFFFGSPGADERIEFGGQAGAFLVKQVAETERLKTSLGSPHRKEHFSTRPEAGFSDVKEYRDFDGFIERLLE